MRGNSRQGFVLSFLLHGVVAATVLFLSLMKPPEKMRPKVFELVYGAPSGDAGATPGEEPPSLELNLPPPVATPRPQQQQPRPQQQQRPRPQPQPTPRPPEPVRTTTPTPVPAPPQQKRPAPAPAETKPTPAPTMSYEEWVRRNGQPRATTTTRPSTPRPRRNIPRIDTDYKNAAQSAMPQGSLRGTSDAEQTALGRYISAVTDLLHDAWDKPVGLAQSTSAVVDFDISPDGKFVNVRITRRSGNAQFDESVLECFRNADSPGSPPNGHTLSLHLTISMTDE